MEIAEKRLEVFILGAGFSRSFCKSIPLISSLTNLLFDEKAHESTLYPELTKYIRNVYRNSNHYGGTRDIESIATVILTKRIFQDEVEKIQFDMMRYQILKFINDKLKSFSVDLENSSLLTQFISSDRFFRGIEDLRRRRVFISFNYDLIIERLGIRVDYGLIKGYEEIPKLQLGSQFIECIKLHGSLNWFRAKGTTNFDINNVYVVENNDPHFALHSEDIPVFIPMAHSKDSFLSGSLFSTLWAKAIHNLNKADDIYFIGYGFPPSDINNLFLFLNFKDKIRRIVVCFENEADEQLKRLRQIFGPDIVVNEDAKSFIQKQLV